MASRVFEDRLGCWIVPDGAGQVTSKLGRLAGLAALGVKDVFLPRQARPDDFATVRASHGLAAHLWTATDGLSADDYANRFLLDFQRFGSKGAGELNIELPSDPPLKAYMRRAVELIRTRKPNLPLRLNIAPFKAFALPIDLLQSDPRLYACEQSFYGDMSRVAESDALYDLLSWGVPLAQATVCYGGAALVPFFRDNLSHGTQRVVGLGTLWTWSSAQRVGSLKRGVIFQDDLLADAGLL